MRTTVLGLLLVVGCAEGAGAPDNSSGQAGTTGAGLSAGGTAGGSIGGAGGGSSPASAAFVEVACAKASTSTATAYTTHYAEVSVPGLRPTAPRKAAAITCTADAILPSTDGGAPAGHTGDPDPNDGTCAETVIRYGTDRLLVLCGFTVNGTPVNRYSKAYVRVE